MLNASLIIILTLVLIIADRIYHGNKINHSNPVLIDSKMSVMIKAMAIISVVVCHVGLNTGSRIFTPLGGIGVFIFFFISGYGLSESFKVNGNNAFFKKRISKVIVPYYIVILLFILYNYPNISYVDAIKYFLLILLPSGMFWFIPYVCLWYILFYIVSIIKNKYIKIACFYIISVLMLLLFENKLMREQSFSFFIGVLCSEFSDNIINFMDRYKAKYISLIFISAAIVILAIKQLGSIRNIVNNNTSIYLAIQMPLISLFGLSIIIYCSRCQRYMPSKLIWIIGVNSYEIYLMHAFCIMIIPFLPFYAMGVLCFIILTFITTIIFIKINQGLLARINLPAIAIKPTP